MSIIETSMEILPFVTATGAAVAGSTLAGISQRRNAAERQALSEEWGMPHIQLSRAQKLAAAILSPLTAVTALVGAANGIVWQPEKPTERVPAHVEVVVDHSGTTAVGEKPTISLINGVIADLDSSKFDAQALVASSGKTLPMQISEVPSAEPFGDAPMSKATENALASLSVMRQKAFAGEATDSLGAVIVTNGNNIGDAATVAQSAKTIGVPMFIVNIEAGIQEPAVTAGLEAIAKTSGGKYWDITDINAHELADQVDEALSGADAHDKSRSNNVLNRFLAGGLGLIAIGLTRRAQRNQPLTYNGNIKDGE